MRRNRYKPIFLPIFGILIVLIGIPVWMTVAEVRQQERNRALLAAIKRNDTRAAVKLLEQGADPNARDEPRRDVSVWRLLLDRLRGKHLQAASGDHALILALKQRDESSFELYDKRYFSVGLETIRALINHGADINVSDGWENLLTFGASDDDEVFDLALQCGTDINAHATGEWTPLMIAARAGDTRKVRILLQKGADTNIVDEDGSTALILTASGTRNCLDVVNLLIKYGADVNRRDNYGSTALIEACHYQWNDEALSLLAHGANADLSDNRGFTPLMWAAYWDSVSVVRSLLACHVDVNAVNEDGVTAYSILEDDLNSDRTLTIRKLLRQAGSNKEGEPPPDGYRS